MTKDIIIKKEHLITKRFSISMKKKNMSVDDFYSRIKENAEITYEAMLKERMGFWKVGQLLNKAKKQLRQGFKQLSKRLINGKIISLRNQQRFMKISSSKRIGKIIMRLPPTWTIAEWVDSLPEHKFKQIEDKINRKVEKKELEQIIGVVKRRRLQGTFNPLRNEIASVLVDEVKIKKTDAKSLRKFIKDFETLTKRYSFLKLYKKDYLKQMYEFLSVKKLRDDTKQTSKKFKSYSAKRKIDV